MRQTLVVTFIAAIFGLALVRVQAQETKPDVVPDSSAKAKDGGWHNLLDKDAFDKSWARTQFGGEGKVSLEKGLLTLGTGQPLTGITWKGDGFPTDNYEVKWKAQRTDGGDFFACLTFPVDKEFCSVVVGGWGGGIVGLSNVNGSDASENETTRYISFENNKWYEFHLSVTAKQILFTIDGKDTVEVEREGTKFGTRIEVLRCRPLGYCVYQSVAQIKDFEYRSIGDSSPQPDAQSSTPQFFRTLADKDEILQSLQTAIAKYKIEQGPFAGAEIDLVGAVHVGEVAYYKELNNRFKSYDAVLFELVADPSIRLADRNDTKGVINPISSMQVGMKDALQLEFQLDMIDYDAKNFVHADMTPAEFMEDMAKRKDSFINMFARVLGSSIAAQSSQSGQDVAMVAALLQPDRAAALRRVFATQIESSEAQLAGLADANGQSTLVTERNAKAMKVLNEQLSKGKRKIAIFYGAAHLHDMHERLLRDFHASLVETEWLDAWNLR
jgi:hypothetical protein